MKPNNNLKEWKSPSDIGGDEFQHKRLKFTKEITPFEGCKRQLDQEYYVKRKKLAPQDETGEITLLMDHHYKMCKLIDEFVPQKAKELAKEKFLYAIGEGEIEKYGIHLIGRALESNESAKIVRLNEDTLKPRFSILHESIKRSKVIKVCEVYLSPLNCEKIMRTVGKILEKNTSITKLQLEAHSSESIAAGGIAGIIPILQKNPFITTLKFYEVFARDNEAHSFFEKFRNTHITKLNLHTNGIDSKDVQALSESLLTNQKLTKLKMSLNYDLESSDIMPLINVLNNSNLIALDLSSNSIDDTAGIVLAQTLVHNKTLAHLDLRSNQIDIGTARAFGETLKINNTLTLLDLSSSNFGIEGVGAIANALKVNNTLTCLYLSDDDSYMNITDEGVLSLVHSLKENHSISILGLGGSEMSNVGAGHLVALLETNKTLLEVDLRYSENISGQMIKAVKDKSFLNNSLTIKALNKYVSIQQTLQDKTIPMKEEILSLEEAISLSQHTSCSLKSFEAKLKRLGMLDFFDGIQQDNANNQEIFDAMPGTIQAYFPDI